MASGESLAPNEKVLPRQFLSSSLHTDTPLNETTLDKAPENDRVPPKLLNDYALILSCLIQENHENTG